MTWTVRVVLRFVIVGELMAALLAIAFGATAFDAIENGRGVYLFFLCLLALIPLGVSGYAYSLVMRTRALRSTRGFWVRVVVGAVVTLVVAFAFDVVAHAWSLSRCHLCSVEQHFPPVRLLHFVSRFLKELGLVAVAIGGLCALVSPRESWDEYVKRRGLEVGQLE